MRPPTQYFGSKGRLAGWIAALLPAHRTYVRQQLQLDHPAVPPAPVGRSATTWSSPHARPTTAAPLEPPQEAAP